MKENDLFEEYVDFFVLVHVPSTNIDEEGFMGYTAASHQEVINAVWLHFWSLTMLSIFIYGILWNHT